MADVHNKETRSYNMSRIKGKNSKPEMIVRKYLHSKGLRFRIHASYLPGNPDIVLPKFRTVIFVHGCFWHKHKNCKYFVVPKTRTEWWLNKINATVERDNQQQRSIRDLGWNVIIIWECELKNGKKDGTLSFLYDRIVGNIPDNFF
jgi:DNA mismatch endonuclease (patch repair protein)